MASKKEKGRLEETFDFIITHADIVGMMNDPDVMLADGSVESGQGFQLLLKRANGAEVIMKDMSSTDDLLIRFKRITITSTDDDFDNVDVN